MKFKVSRSMFLVIIFLFGVNFFVCSCSKNFIEIDKGEDDKEGRAVEMFQADPTVFTENDTYYLYGTNDENPNNGFQVFTSTNMKTWWGPKGLSQDFYALYKGGNFGTTGFWAPQVWKYKNQYYMAYTANENIAISVSDSPLGPFNTKDNKPVFSADRQIDPFVFIDDDDKKYLFYVRLINGNRIYAAEMNDDFSHIKPETVTECLSATENWENTENASWPVAEGPTVLKHKGYYYLIYSANDFRNPDYAVGYAVSENIFGPWVKSDSNPVLSRHNSNWAGSGHGDIGYGKDGQMYYVFHTHNLNNPTPRKTAIVKARFEESESGPDKLVFDGKGMYHLNAKQ